jgi:hypothetical protein
MSTLNIVLTNLQLIYIITVVDDKNPITVVNTLTSTSRLPVWIVLGLVVTVIFVALLYGLYVLLTIARQRPDQQISLDGKHFVILGSSMQHISR